MYLILTIYCSIPLDFSIADTQLTFSPGGGPQTECTDVTILSNDGLESEEFFILSLESEDPAVNIGSMAVTRIIITNTDGNNCVE